MKPLPKDFLLQNTEDAIYVRSQIINFLVSNDKDAQLVALELIKQGGVHWSFFAALWRVYYGQDAAARALIRKLLYGLFGTLKLLTTSSSLAVYLKNKAGYDKTVKMFLAMRSAQPKIPVLDLVARDMYTAMNGRATMDKHFYALYGFLMAHCGSEGRRALLAQRLWHSGTYLNMSGSQATFLPEEISYFPNLERVNISNSKIKTLPKALFELAGLRQFDYEGSEVSLLEVQRLYNTSPILEASRNFMVAASYMQSRKRTLAMPFINKAVHLLPTEIRFWLLYVEVHHDDLAANLRAYETLVGLAPNNEAYQKRLAYLRRYKERNPRRTKL